MEVDGWFIELGSKLCQPGLRASCARFLFRLQLVITTDSAACLSITFLGARFLFTADPCPPSRLLEELHGRQRHARCACHLGIATGAKVVASCLEENKGSEYLGSTL